MNARTLPPACAALGESKRVVARLGASALLLGSALLAPAYGQAGGGPYTLPAYTISAGGGRATGGVYALEGSIGQHDASNALLGGVYELRGGFHRRAPGAVGSAIFHSGFE